MGYVQPQPRPLAGRFGSEKSVENSGLNLGRDSRPVIDDVDLDAALGGVGGDRDLSLAVHRVCGVVDQVGKKRGKREEEGREKGEKKRGRKKKERIL